MLEFIQNESEDKTQISDQEQNPFVPLPRCRILVMTCKIFSRSQTLSFLRQRVRPVNTGNKEEKRADLWTETQENARRTSPDGDPRDAGVHTACSFYKLEVSNVKTRLPGSPYRNSGDTYGDSYSLTAHVCELDRVASVEYECGRTLLDAERLQNLRRLSLAIHEDNTL
ncbi:hypothetical protein Bbelb_334590 [Branchiostoma belcheri]|nr:hypothetical protein Bbelb_334590 [Branchiostoma belcheri]